MRVKTTKKEKLKEPADTHTMKVTAAFISILSIPAVNHLSKRVTIKHFEYIAIQYLS